MFFGRSIIAIIVVLIAHAVGMFGVYWTHKWFDTPVHFLGGFAAGMLALDIWKYSVEVIRTKNHIPPSGIVFLFVIGITALIGVAWEVHEYMIDQLRNIDIARQPGLTDTMKDLVVDIMGGVTAYVVTRGK